MKPYTFMKGKIVLRADVVSWSPFSRIFIFKVTYSALIAWTVPAGRPEVKCPARGHNGDTAKSMISVTLLSTVLQAELVIHVSGVHL